MAGAIGSILVGTDGSATATTALRYAIDLARELGARLMIVSAYEPVSDQRPRVREILFIKRSAVVCRRFSRFFEG